MPSPNYRDLNAIIAQTLAGVSTTLRFPGQLNSDFRKLAVNLIPFPRLHFLTVGYAPLTKPGSRDYIKTGIPELTSELFNPQSFLAACNPMDGKYLTCCEPAVRQTSNQADKHFSYLLPRCQLVVPRSRRDDVQCARQELEFLL